MRPLHQSRPGQWSLCLRAAVLMLTCLWVDLTSGQPTHTDSSSASEAVAIIVNKANSVENLSTEELRKYFRLEREHWPDGRKNTVLMLPPGSPEREVILRQLYHLLENEFTRHFLQANYSGQAHSVPKELASSINVRKFVFNVPGAIGYMRASEVNDTVKLLRIDGHLPGDSGYPLRVLSK